MNVLLSLMTLPVKWFLTIPAAGEFRAHYAGFFDPGWGLNSQQRGAKAVLEVRPHEDDLILRHGQPICAMAYERPTEAVSIQYGTHGNNYTNQDGLD